MRPALRSSPLFPPWFLSAPVSNLASGTPLACPHAARRPPPGTAPPASVASRPLPTALAAQAWTPLPPPPPPRKVKFEEGGRGKHGHEEEDPPGAEEPNPGSCKQSPFRAPSPSDDLHVMVATCGAPAAGSSATAQGRAQLAGLEGEGGQARRGERARGD